jgi:UTP--glucose-1-phosphate uridylyltransferase
MDAFEAKMKADGLNEAAIAAFRHNYEQLLAGETGLVPESEIEPVTVSPSSQRRDPRARV